jgi:polysaccharide pyruvyl transferase WcaK-like protein
LFFQLTAHCSLFSLAARISTGMKDHLLFTGLGAGNIGDEAMFAGLLSGYSLCPETTVEVYDALSPVVESLPQQLTYLDQRDRESCRKAALCARGVILAGGTPVTEDLGLEWPMRFLCAELDFLVDRGCAVHALGVGVDPLCSKEAVELFRKSFGRIETWTVRSEQCRQALLELGVAERNVHVAADLAWLFTPKGEKRDWAEGFWRELGIDPSGALIAVNVVNERWPGPTATKRAIARGLDEAIRRTGIQVAFMCNETREGDYFDAAAAREVAGLMEESAAIVPPHYFTPAEMCALLGHCTLTLSQRYHFTVLSILSGTVPLSFSRGWKMVSLLYELGEEPVGAMDSCSPGLLTESIEHALSNRAAIRERQQATAERLRTRAGENFVFLNSRPPGKKSQARPASVSQLESLPFTRFLEMLGKLWKKEGA